MKGKLNAKTIIVLIILLLVCVLSVLGVQTAKTYFSSAAGGCDPQNVIVKPGEDGKAAVITWTTEKACMAVVEYGMSPGIYLLQSPDVEQVTEHRLDLKPLKSNVSYYFRIKVGDEIFDNSGTPFTFKTKTAIAEVTPTPAPLVNDVATTLPAQPIGIAVTAPAAPVVTGKVCDRATDYNKDTVVNSLDYLYCLKSDMVSTTAPATNVGTTLAVGITTPISVAATTPAAVSSCVGGVDYNKDGIINSMDIIKCRQGTR